MQEKTENNGKSTKIDCGKSFVKPPSAFLVPCFVTAARKELFLLLNDLCEKTKVTVAEPE